MEWRIGLWFAAGGISSRYSSYSMGEIGGEHLVTGVATAGVMLFVVAFICGVLNKIEE